MHLGIFHFVPQSRPWYLPAPLLYSRTPLELSGSASSLSPNCLFWGGAVFLRFYSSNYSRLGLAGASTLRCVTRIRTLLVHSCVSDQPSCGATCAWSVATGSPSPASLPRVHAPGLILNGLSLFAARCIPHADAYQKFAWQRRRAAVCGAPSSC